jgi:hypothetical protein
MTSHYLPAYCEINGVKQRAACGAWISPAQHSLSPLCDGCRNYILAEAAVDNQMLQMAAETNDPALIVKPREFDILDGYSHPKGIR